MNTKAPVNYVALLRTPGGLLQKATICADTFTQAHYQGAVAGVAGGQNNKGGALVAE